MTREQQITQASQGRFPEWGEQQHALELAFQAGAYWADSHPHWISVEDELPKINPNNSEWEYSDDVIVALKDDSIAVGRYERDNSTGEHYWVLYGVDKDLVVIHWMPKPAPPKKGGKEC